MFCTVSPKKVITISAIFLETVTYKVNITLYEGATHLIVHDTCLTLCTQCHAYSEEAKSKGEVQKEVNSSYFL